MKPQEIEDLSFQIIEKEAKNHGFDEKHWPVVRRMIHTSADFDYIRTIRFGNNAVEKGVAAIQKGCSMFTDTNMARVGIRKTEIAHFKGTVSCLMTDPAVAARAAADGTTRALAAVDLTADQLENGIYVVGNAPTALLRLIQLIQEDRVHPALVIGLPVGFVNAAESKQALMALDTPYITNAGRKGGSNVAAAVVNALAIMAYETAVHETP
ncbi:MAG: precorrin-8X methylmutase [Desulfotignum sp.]|nr:precorrin-8X methylmutase [Desulfotignum sp.]MCF8114500.1 precorrin-8X methylmutase [Desulfotignum sp.]